MTELQIFNSEEFGDIRTVTIDGDNQHLTKPVRIGEVDEKGLINEIYATDKPVKPDPYLKSYDWAVKAGIQPLE